MQGNVAAKRARKGTEHILPSFERLPWSSKLCAPPAPRGYPLGRECSGNAGFSGTGVEAYGALNVYPPNANGDVAPEASFTNGMNGPFVVVFDPSGDLWAANVNNGTLVEFTRAQPRPTPCRP